MEQVKLPWGEMYFSWAKDANIYEIEIRDELKCRKNGIAVDIGAHQGYHTLKLANEVGENGIVLAIEPEPRNYDILCKNIELNNLDNVIPIKKAVSNYVGIGTLFTYIYDKGRDTGKHFLRGSHSEQAYGKELGREIPEPNFGTNVMVTTLDKIIEEHELKNLDIIKIDVEGAESRIIEGANNTLSKTSPKLIIEIHFQQNIDRLLKIYGYKLIKTYEDVKITSNPINIYEKKFNGDENK